ncbi:hexose transporter [Mycena epipterygia]|nr:hexose transporter [Mycena epipterygia]
MAGGPVATHTNVYTHLIDPSRKWYNNRRLIVLNSWIVLLLITSSTNGYDGILDPNYFNHPQKGKLGLLNAIQNIGALAGYPFAPYLSDGIGRRRTVFIGALIMCLGTAVQTASQSVGMFIGARFLIGFGLTFAANAAPMLVTELSYPKHRAVLTSCYNSLWYSGAIIAAWATFGSFKIHSTWAWRIPSLLQALPSIFQVCLVLFAPESPRYLHHFDPHVGRDDPLTAIEFDRTVAANIGWKSFLTSPGNRKRVRIIIAIAFFSQWSANGLVSYYLNKVLTSIGVVDPTIQLLINGILQIWNLAWALAASTMVERFGRRLLFLTSVGLMIVFFTVQTVCTARFQIAGSETAAHAVIAFIFLYYAAYDLAFTPLIVTYTLEILPYNIRAKGLTIFNFTISLALIFNQYVNPIALDAIAWKYYIVYCVWLVFEGMFLHCYIIETKNRTLEETAALFDGTEATDQIVTSAAVKAGVTHDIGHEKHEKASTAS